jgi:hypothetical protein
MQDIQGSCEVARCILFCQFQGFLIVRDGIETTSLEKAGGEIPLDIA